MFGIKRSAHQKTDPIQRNVHVSLKELIRLESVAKKLNLANHKRYCSHQAGGHRSTIQGRGMEFDEVRCYQSGDDIRTIDWRVTARTNKTHTKLYHEERERPVMLLVDYSASMYFGTRHTFKSTIAAYIAATLAWTAVSEGDRLGGVIFTNNESVDFRPQAKKRSLLPMLHALANLQPSTHHTKSITPMLSQSLQRLRHVVKPGSIIFIISDFSQYDEDSVRHMVNLNRHNALFACRISDPMEASLPPPNLYSISDGSQSLQFDSSLSSIRQQFKEDYESEYNELKTSLSNLRAPLLEFSTQDNPSKKILQYFGSNSVSRGRHATKR